MKLSVALVTYNHRPFIEQALDSVLRQQMDDDWEIVIGDDASSDGTTDILKAYQQRYPKRIRLCLRGTNGGDNGRRNYIATLNACRGEYVAYLDGDDYWLGEHKLKRQITLLDAQPELAGCAHPVLRVYADGHKDTFGAPPGRAPFTLGDISGNFTFLHCNSFIYRRSVLPELPDWFADRRVTLDDWTLTMLCATRGKIAYIDEVLGVYRKHGQGIWTGQQGLQRLLWDLTTREFAYRKLGTPEVFPPWDNAPFLSTLKRVEQLIAAHRPLAVRCQLSLALLQFPHRDSLSSTYCLMFLVETWGAWSKPSLIRLRRFWQVSCTFVQGLMPVSSEN